MDKQGHLNPLLWEKAKRMAIEKMGEHSARAMQLAGKLYREMGGKYTKNKTQAQKDLTKWTKEEWRTKSGLPSGLTGERYLPKKIIQNLSNKEYQKTTKAKQEGIKQYVKQPKEIVKKIKEIKKKVKLY